MSGGDPGLVFAAVGVVAAIVCGRVAVALFDHVGDRSRPGGLLTFVAFFWGGGLVVLAATAFVAVVLGAGAGRSGFDVAAWWSFIRVVDPAGGWWFLNFGRNLVLPTEAVYHALFFGGVVLILARRFGPLSLHANLWVEQEYYFQEEEWRILYNPTAGVAYQVVPSFFVGLEYWARGRFDEAPAGAEGEGDSAPSSGPHHYGGPTLMVQSEQGFASLGTYLRWDDLGQSAQPDDPWGKVWVRVLFGVDL
jgi:hypothetical protein